MIIHFHEPPKAKSSGGLDLAIRSLEKFLLESGVAVRSAPSSHRNGPVPDVVHFHGLWQPAFLSVSAQCRRLEIPYVVSPHGMLEPWAWRHKRWKKWPWYYLFERRHLRGASRLLATSDVERRNMESRLPSGNCCALPLGLTSERQPDYSDARHKLNWSDSDVVLLFLSRIHPKKGLHLLLRALASVESDFLRNVRLAIVGSGEARYMRRLMGFAQRESKRLPRLDWFGEVWGEDKWIFFQGADLFCLPSHSENFGFAVLEALQVGTPVLTTNQTPWNILPSLGAGLIVGPTENEIKAALVRFLTSHNWPVERRASLASEVHAWFSWSTIGPSYLRFYEDLAGRSPKG